MRTASPQTYLIPQQTGFNSMFRILSFDFTTSLIYLSLNNICIQIIKWRKENEGMSVGIGNPIIVSLSLWINLFKVLNVEASWRRNLKSSIFFALEFSLLVHWACKNLHRICIFASMNLLEIAMQPILVVEWPCKLFQHNFWQVWVSMGWWSEYKETYRSFCSKVRGLSYELDRDSARWWINLSSKIG